MYHPLSMVRLCAEFRGTLRYKVRGAREKGAAESEQGRGVGEHSVGRCNAVKKIQALHTPYVLRLGRMM